MCKFLKKEIYILFSRRAQLWVTFVIYAYFSFFSQKIVSTIEIERNSEIPCKIEGIKQHWQKDEEMVNYFDELLFFLTKYQNVMSNCSFR